ncbi:MAG: LuxR family transcriptional regulator [Rhodospirillales bacterium]
MKSLINDYGAEFSKTESFDHSLDVLLEIVEQFGFTQVLYAYQPFSSRLVDGQWMPLRLNVRNFPKGWYAEWQNYEAHDPYYHACFDQTLPFEWDEVQRSETLGTVERQAWQYLADLGLGRGITIPLHLPAGRFAVVSAILDRSNANWSHIKESSRDALFRLTHVFHESIHRKGFESQIEVAELVRLSPRERECLRWAAAGKTSPETAVIIDRSCETVRLHMKNALLKLNVHNRAHAISKATQLGLLEFDKGTA